MWWNGNGIQCLLEIIIAGAFIAIPPLQGLFLAVMGWSWGGSLYGGVLRSGIKEASAAISIPNNSLGSWLELPRNGDGETSKIQKKKLRVVKCRRHNPHPPRRR